MSFNISPESTEPIDLASEDELPTLESLANPEEEEVEVVAKEEPQEKPIINPEGRARILSRERDDARRDQEILAARLQNVLNRLPDIVSNAAANAKTQPVEPDTELDPITALLRENQATRAEIRDLRNAMAQGVQISAEQQALNVANNLVSHAVSQSPEFSAAISHLSQVVMNDLDDKFPDATIKEKLALADQAIQAEKIGWIKKGKNPVNEFYRKAQILGFSYRPPEPATETDDAPAAKREKETPKSQIQKEKNKQTNMASIGGASSGASVRKVDGRALAAMPEDQFNRTIEEGISAGLYKLDPGKKNPSIDQIFAGLENKPTRTR